MVGSGSQYVTGLLDWYHLRLEGVIIIRKRGEFWWWIEQKNQTASRKMIFRLGKGGYKWGVGGIVKDGQSGVHEA